MVALLLSCGGIRAVSEPRRCLNRQTPQTWSGICRATAAAFTAALPRCAEVMAETQAPPHSCFQFFGLDFLLDARGRCARKEDCMRACGLWACTTRLARSFEERMTCAWTAGRTCWR